MRPCSAALSTLLNDPTKLASVQVDLYTVALVTGEVLRWSGSDFAITIPSAGFPAESINAGGDRTFLLGPKFGRSKVSTKIGVQATELDIDIMAGAGDMVGSFSIAQAARVGIFDGATVELDRFFAPPQVAGSGALDTSLGVLLWFYGRVADCDVGRSKIAVKVKSLMNLLAVQQMPRRIYGASCTHVFGDAMCGYDRVLGKNALGTSTGVGQVTITATDTVQAQITNGTAIPAGYDQGTIVGLTGANTGYTRTVFGVATPIVYLKQPFLFPVVIGDTFGLLPGCDHTSATCNSPLQNLLRFGGFPYIPPPEVAV
jgi:uncharacterized phage protein (TIGR02218 family)